MQTEIIEVGDALGLILPDGVLARLDVKVGDDMLLIEREGSLYLERIALPKGAFPWG
jgi:hypothetical protein